MYFGVILLAYTNRPTLYCKIFYALSVINGWMMFLLIRVFTDLLLFYSLESDKKSLLNNLFEILFHLKLDDNIWISFVLHVYMVYH